MLWLFSFHKDSPKNEDSFKTIYQNEIFWRLFHELAWIFMTWHNLPLSYQIKYKYSRKPCINVIDLIWSSWSFHLKDEDIITLKICMISSNEILPSPFWSACLNKICQFIVFRQWNLLKSSFNNSIMCVLGDVLFLHIFCILIINCSITLIQCLTYNCLVV